MGLMDATRTGLYDQLLDAANVINAVLLWLGVSRMTDPDFPDGRSMTLLPRLNPGTAAGNIS